MNGQKFAEQQREIETLKLRMAALEVAVEALLKASEPEPDAQRPARSVLGLNRKNGS